MLCGIKGILLCGFDFRPRIDMLSFTDQYPFKLKVFYNNNYNGNIDLLFHSIDYSLLVYML